MALSTAEDAIDFVVEQVPGLAEVRDESVADNAGECLPYVLFGSYFMPWLRTRLEEGDEATARRFIAAAEAVLGEGRGEAENLVFIEFAEWLAHDPLLPRIESLLGPLATAAIQRARTAR